MASTRMGTSNEPDLLSENQRITLLCVAVLALCAAGYTWTSGTIITVSQDGDRFLRDSAEEGLCAGLAVKDGCVAFHAQKPIPAVKPPRGQKTCLQNCNHVGSCFALTGMCQCPAGWAGPGCLRRHRRPCTHRIRQWGFSFADPNPVNLSDFLGARPGVELAHFHSGICGGQCDDDIAMCYCPSNTTYGRNPAPHGSIPGTPPLRVGRPMGQDCQPNKDWEGRDIYFGTLDADKLFGKEGWCTAEKPTYRCGCLRDGLAGPTCEIPMEMSCVNQCNGHGECNLGFCKCHEGWFGHDCAYRMEGIEDAPGLEESRPWIAAHVHTPAAKDPEPGSTRLRPLIWVYELPTDYNSLLLQYQVDRGFGLSRMYYDVNVSVPNDSMPYALEMGFHEMMLQSPHRTLDPEEADFFYVPVYTNLIIIPVSGWADGPYYYAPHLPRTVQATGMLEETQMWIQSHYPYWNRKGGRDHIWLVTHDEGSCWVPNNIRSSIILSHWGRHDVNHTPWTHYGPDIYSGDHRHELWMPKGHLHRLTTGPCYNSSKDLIVPSLHSPRTYAASPMLGNPTVPRTYLAIFKGRMQFFSNRYSRMTRQRLAKKAWKENWADEHRILVLDHDNRTEMSYSELMASSKFCLAIIGDGWTTRFEDAIVHGCIPVAVMDDVDPVYASIINETDISVRIAFADVERLPEILKAIPEGEVLRLQTNIGKVWRRFAWTSLKWFKDMASEKLEENWSHANWKESETESQPPRERVFDPAQGDAFQTLMEWLYGRMDKS